jgi:orotidine-5'-phosphate decarboxylase
MGLTRAEAVERLVVALDTPDRTRALELARTLAGRVGMLKVGLEAFTALGPSLVEELAAAGMPVFLDLKLHDIPNTVEGAAAACARLGAAIFNVHAAGGQEMMRAALAGAERGTAPGAPRPRVLAVTVLTSLDEPALGRLGVVGTAGEVVVRWACLAREAACDGVVCSPREVATLRATLGEAFVLLTPGIRPAGQSSGDQRRVATPAAAVAGGANYLVIGRPITGSPDPAAAAEAILGEMCDAPA